MSQRTLKFTLLLAMVAAPAIGFAQEVSSKEEERLEQLVRSEAEWYAPKNSVTVGFHVLTNGGNVRFGNLGTVGYHNAVVLSDQGAIKRTYDNGYVNLDGPRSAELDSYGNQTSTPGGRYKTYGTTTTPVTDANGNETGTVSTSVVTGDYLSYTPGLTREWSYSTAAQTTDKVGYIAMNSYRAQSEGESLSKKQGASAGVELQYAYALRSLSKKVELSLVTGIALNGINNKTAGDVHSTLYTQTDYYKIPDGLSAPAIPEDLTLYTAPYFPTQTDTTLTLETTVPIATTPDATLSGEKAGAVGSAIVHGRWQVKGAYFMVRVGPMLRAQLSERFGLTASLGLAGAYAGTHYSVTESIDIPNLTATTSGIEAYSDASKFVGGYYADLNLEWTANDTMGLFGGVSAQKLGAYNQTLDARTARVDLGSTVGLRGGVSIKF